MEKRDILEAIRQKAENNGGAPLGKKRFAEETGIREGDWLGKHWATWGDAIREAGLEPNILQGKFDDAAILEKLADLVLVLEKLPTEMELRLHERQDPEFPSHNVYRRYGRKANLIEKLLAFTEPRDRFGRVAQLCRVYLESNPVQREPEKDTNPVRGYVYLIKSGRYYKIGRTNSIGRRERELSLQLPEKTRTAHTIATDDPKGIEAYWHSRFAERRKNGEWFELKPSDVSAFKRRKFM